MKKIIALMLVLAMSVCVLASCGGVEPTTVKVRFVDWDTNSTNETVIYETEVTFKTANPTLYNVIKECEKANEDVKPEFGKTEGGEVTLPDEYFGRKEHNDEDVSPIVLYRWWVIVTEDKAPNENSDTVENINTVVKNGQTITFAYYHWENTSKD